MIIDKQSGGLHRLHQSSVPVPCHIRAPGVQKLTEIFAIRSNVEMIITFGAHGRPKNPEEFVFRLVLTLVAVINHYYGQKIL